VDEVNRVVPQLIRHGKITRPGMGVQLLPDQTARQLKVREGVLIFRVIPGSGADQAGLRPTRRDEDGQVIIGDVIVAVDGKPVKKVNDLFTLLGKYEVGATVTLTILRDGQREQVEVTLGQVD
jgi:S1-C subfamily serine protease